MIDKLISKNDKNIVVALDIGTTNVVTLVGEINEDEPLSILGLGTSRSLGMKKGIVIDINATVDSIRKSIEEAQINSQTPIKSVVTGIAGNHVKSFNSTGAVAISSKEVGIEDKDAVLENACAITIPPNQSILHKIPQNYIIDDQEGIREPLGMNGNRLETRAHIVTGATNAIENIEKCVNKCDVSVERIVLEQLASSEAVLTNDEKDLGICIVDIGGGTTDIAIFTNGSIEYTSSIAIGGDQVTNDIAVALKTGTSNAEDIKIKYGCAKTQMTIEDETIEVPGVGDRPSRKLHRQTLAEVIEPRYAEIFEFVDEIITTGGYEPRIPAGIVLTGGSSKISGLVELAEEVFHKQVRIGMPQDVIGAENIIKNPMYSTATGLLMYAANDIVVSDTHLSSDFANVMRKIWGRLSMD